MIHLPGAARAWGTPGFKGTLKQEIEQLGVEELPLQEGLSVGNHALDSNLNVMIISVSDLAGSIRVKAGIFYTSIIAGCSCADDPTPLDMHSEYCEVQIEIDKNSAEAEVALLVK